MGGYTMNRVSIKLLLALVVSFSIIFAREKVSVEHSMQLKSLANSNSLISKPVSNESGVDREQIILYSEDFEGDHGWEGEAGWTLTEDNFNSESHSWNSPNDASTSGGVWKLFSPVISLPDVGDNDVVQFGFHIFGDMPDTDGDGDNYLEDYYSVSIMDPSALAWGSDGETLWCADEEVGGYLDSWMQFLDLPEMMIGDGMTLSADMQWGIEDPAGAVVSGSCTDGWDAANVRISTDGGTTWDLLVGSDPYDFDCGYGWIWNDAEYDTNGDLNHLASGWGGQADWHNVSFDLSDYAGQNAIIRFAFGSDPAYCTTDDASLTGFKVDNILVSNGQQDMYTCDGSDMCDATANGAVWVDQFYDYCDDTRPGGMGFWEEYMPGYPFNGNVFMDITNFAGGDIIVRFQSRYDENDDGGSGTGLFIDDFKVYMEAPAGPAPSGLMAEALDSQVDLSWNDMNLSGTFDYVYDNDSFSNAISLTQGEGFAGSSFEIVGASTVNSVDVYNNNGGPVTTTIAAFGTFGSFFDVNPMYAQEVTLEDGWNNVVVSGWDFNNKFIVAMGISSEIAIALDESVAPSSNSYILFGSWDPWSDTGPPAGLPDGEWGIRANITQEGANATYNVYRDGNQIANGLDQNSFSDSDLDNNVTYSYQLSATYSSGDESDLSESVEATPQSNTVYELSHDDGSAEAGANVGSGDFMVVKYTTSGPNQNTVRAKWYQNDAGGAFYLKMFEDNNGSPGTEIFSTIRTGGIVGWNTYDLSDEGLALSGDFWVGVKEFSSTRPFGLDTDSDSGNSYYSTDGVTWNPISGLGEAGNLMIRVFLDAGEGGGGGDCTLGDANSDGGVDVLDIVVIVNFILTNVDIDECAADANEDGGIDVLDIVTIVNNILGG
tara:strand:+ start:1582 stop:4236 length:2655 start_codon:yes stop_codon:yes gene_type:complete